MLKMAGKLELKNMDNIGYILIAAQHSRYNAGHWFRYLRKIINESGTSISSETIDSLYSNELLTPFQRVSLKAAFDETTETHKHVISLSQRVVPNKLAQVRSKYEQ